MPFTIIRQDITKMKVDAIVNAANTDLKMGGGVCYTIFTAAGCDDLKAACDRLAPVKTGDAVITPGFDLPAKYIIHTPGPVYIDGQHNEARLLEACYVNSLKRALENLCKSIAFPLISTGIFGYPKNEALRVATSVIQRFLLDHEMDVYLAVFDKESFEVSKKLLGEVKSYIDEHYITADQNYTQRRSDAAGIELCELKISHSRIDPQGLRPCLEDVIDNLDEPFSETLMRLIDSTGKTDVLVYKRANIDRKLFSKIRTGRGYMPGKRTVIALAVSLELTLDQTKDLLARAGYALSGSRIFDVIVEYFIVNGKYDIYEINEVLFKYDQSLLGG